MKGNKKYSITINLYPMKTKLKLFSGLLLLSVAAIISCQKPAPLAQNSPGDQAELSTDKKEPSTLATVVTPWPIVCCAYTMDGKLFTLPTSGSNPWTCPPSNFLMWNSINVNWLTGVAQKSASPTTPANNYVITTGANSSFPKRFFEVSGSGGNFTVTAMGASFASVGGDISDVEFLPGNNSNLYGIRKSGSNYSLVLINGWHKTSITPAVTVLSANLNGNFGFGAGPFGFTFDGTDANKLYIYDKSSGKAGKFQLNGLSPITQVGTVSGVHFSSHGSVRTCLIKSGNTLFIGDNDEFRFGTWQTSIMGGYDGCYPEDGTSFPLVPCYDCND